LDCPLILHENLRLERNEGTYEESVIMVTSNDRDNHGILETEVVE